MNEDRVSEKTVAEVAVRAGKAFERLVQTMAALRAPDGCPWDAEQTHQSLIRYLIEESYEVVEAVEAPEGTNLQLLREELGDVLLQVLFHADIAAAEPGGFTIEQVIEGLDAKLHDRHPNVFGDSSGESRMTVAEQQVFWDELKKKEKSDRGPLDGIPPHLPALADIVLPPEPTSLDDDLPFTYSEEDFGELLFSLVCRARQNGLDAERALRTYTRKFIEYNS